MTNNTITINSKKNTIEITKAFEKAASRFGSDEYNMLRQAHNDNPRFRVVVIRRKTSSVSFKGLTYEYMEKYIKAHDEEGTIMAEFKDLRATSDAAIEACAEALSYGEIKAWFLNTYPAIKTFHERRTNQKTA
jgi:hypothetical protein